VNSATGGSSHWKIGITHENRCAGCTPTLARTARSGNRPSIVGWSRQIRAGAGPPGRLADVSEAFTRQTVTVLRVVGRAVYGCAELSRAR
jgi:hypothetical protein